MISAILDTNVVIQAAISRTGASYQVVQALFARQFEICISADVLDELYQVLTAPTIQARHAWDEQEVRDYIQLLVADAKLYPNQTAVSVSTARDVTDTKFLALAAESAANYLVTNDRRHLVRLGQVGMTKIVTPHKFLSFVV